jgi:hypothetical protein
MDGPAEKPRGSDEERKPRQEVATEFPRLSVRDLISQLML